MKLSILLFVLFALLALTVNATSLRRGISYDDEDNFSLIEESADLDTEAEVDSEKADVATETENESTTETETEADPSSSSSSSTGVAAPTPAVPTPVVNAPILQKVTVIPGPATVHKVKKQSGKYDHKPLLDNGKVFLKTPYVPKTKKDPCGGPCDIIVDKKAHALNIKKKVLPVLPEMRRRTTKADRKYWADQAKKNAASGISDRHMKPEFYPTPKLKKSSKKAKLPVTKRLPSIPEFYPKRPVKRIIPLPKCGQNCLKCSVVNCAANTPSTTPGVKSNDPSVATISSTPVGTGVAVVAAGSLNAPAPAVVPAAASPKLVVPEKAL